MLKFVFEWFKICTLKGQNGRKGILLFLLNRIFKIESFCVKEEGWEWLRENRKKKKIRYFRGRRIKSEFLKFGAFKRLVWQVQKWQKY